MIKKNVDVISLFESDRPEEFRYEKVDGGIRIVAYSGAKDYVKIPEEIDGNVVIEIGEYRGGNISSIHPSILLPKTISRFDPEAFHQATRDLWMKDVYVCDDNPYFKVEDGILYSADMKVLYFCFNRGITEIKMPNTVEVVKKGAFRAVTNPYILDDIIWSKNLKEIEDYAFFSLSLDVCEEVNLPAAVKSLGLMAFNKSTRIVLNGEIESLTGCPAGEFNINNDYYITDNGFLYSADKKIAIGYCMKTLLSDDEIISEKAISFESPTETILPYAFYNFSRLEKLDLGSSVKYIGSHAFQKSRIKTIRIPAQVEEIADDAFGYDRCSSIIVAKENTHFLTDKVCLYRINEDGSKTLMKCFKDSIEEYAILDGTKDIYYKAFSSCNSLKMLILPDSLKVFDGCCIRSTSIKSIAIPKGVQSLVNMAKVDYSLAEDNPYLVFEGKVLYERCDNGLVAVDSTVKAKAISIKEGTIEIANHAFSGFSKITSVTLPDSLIRIGHDAFSRCKIKQVVFNSGLKEIDDCAFEKCELETINLPDSVEYVCRTAFKGCPVSEYNANNQFYHSEDGVLYSSDNKILYAFPIKKKGDAFAVPEGVKHIGQAFTGCTLKKLSLPDSVEVLVEQSLECEATDITTGKNLASIDKQCLSLYVRSLKGKSYAFHGYPDSVLMDFVTYLKMRSNEITADIELFGTEAFSSLSDEFDVIPNGNGVIITKHKTDNSDVVIPACIGDYSVVGVSDIAFYGQEIRSLVVESAKTSVNFGSFRSLEEIVLPEGMKEISDNAFERSKLKSITLPQSVERIGKSAFNHCYKLESVTIPGNVKVLSENLFTHCENLKVVVIEEGVEKICSGVFFGCKSLERMVLPGSITSISKNLFSDGNRYKDLYLNSKTTYITIPRSYADKFLRKYEVGPWDKFSLKVMNSKEFEYLESLEVFNAFLYKPNGKDTVRVILKSRVENAEPNVVIPERIGEKSVTEVGIEGTYIREKIESIEIPSSVELIDELDKAAFERSSLKSIIVSADNSHYWSDGKALYSKDKKKLIHIFAFDLTEYKVSDGVNEICAAAFSCQKNITKVVLPDSVEQIGESAFYHCDNLSEIVGADKVKNVAANAYENTPYFQNLPVLIHGDIFRSCSIADQTVIKVPEGIREIASNAFNAQNSLVEKIELPTTLRKIGRNAFGGMKKLTELTIPNGVEKIVDYLFAGMESVKTINLPASVTSIGYDVFPGRSYSEADLESINVDSGNSVYSSLDGILYSKDMTTLIKVPCAYPASKIVLPDTVTTISANAFAANKTVVEVVLPIATNQICANAFDSCKALEAINLSGIQVMEEEAFSRCKKLKAIKLSCATLPKAAFDSCYELESVDLVGTEEIGEQAFRSCYKITSILFPESLKKIGVSAFNGCGLESVTIPQNIQDVGRFAFNGVKHINIFDTLKTEIGYLGIPYVDYKNYVHYHVISVLSSETGLEKFSVPMDSDGSADYCYLLTHSWGEGATFNFKAIDDYFSKLKGADVKQRTCINRLKNPIDLSDSARKTYIAYAVKKAKAIMMSFIDENDIDSFSKFESFGTIKKANVDDLIEYAAQKQAVAFSAFLMDYKEKNFGSKKSTKSAFSLGSTRSVAPWQISKNALFMVGRYKGYEISIEFPTELDGKKITGIANSSTTVPDNYRNIVSVIIPEGYDSIGDNAFLGCENLEKVVLPSSLERIGKSAFANCKKLKEMIIPDTVKKIGMKCFQGCASLEKVKLSMRTEKLEQSAFEGCHALKDIDIPRSIRSIKDRCFSSSGIKTATIHNRNTWIADSAFDKGVSFIAYKGAVSSKAVKEITLADLHYENSKYSFTSVKSIDFNGKIFVLTGFSESDEKVLTKIIEEKGGEVKSSVVLKTDYLIVNEDYDHVTTKYKKAVELNGQGKNIAILSASAFNKLSK